MPAWEAFFLPSRSSDNPTLASAEGSSCLDGSVGGCLGCDHKDSSILLKLSMTTSKMCGKCYDQLKSQIFENIRPITLAENSKNIRSSHKTSPRGGKRVNFQKNIWKECNLKPKISKYSKSKNDLKCPLWALIKELGAILVFTTWYLTTHINTT